MIIVLSFLLLEQLKLKKLTCIYQKVCNSNALVPQSCGLPQLNECGYATKMVELACYMNAVDNAQ
jgi:hypothetical protein